MWSLGLPIKTPKYNGIVYFDGVVLYIIAKSKLLKLNLPRFDLVIDFNWEILTASKSDIPAFKLLILLWFKFKFLFIVLCSIMLFICYKLTASFGSVPSAKFVIFWLDIFNVDPFL